MFSAAVAVAIFVGLYLILRTRELFRLSVRNGRVLIVRGRVPPAFVSDVKSILASPLSRSRNVKRATITAQKTENGGRLTISGDIDRDSAQRLRNTFSTYTLARLEHAPAIRKPTLGQVLGIAWLAWLLERTFDRNA